MRKRDEFMRVGEKKFPLQKLFLTMFGIFAVGWLFSILCLAAQSGEKSDKRADRSAKLPSAQKIVDEYLRAIGGRKRASEARDAVYEWDAQLSNDEHATAQMQIKFPAAWRMNIKRRGEETVVAANARAAWRRERDGAMRTLTDTEAQGLKLRAALWASRLVDYKKSNIMARVIKIDEAFNKPSDETFDEPLYVVEFSTRSGASVLCAFGARSKLLRSIEDDAAREVWRLSDYRAQNLLLEPQRIEIFVDGKKTMTLALRAVRYNANLDAALFDAPREVKSGETAETIDVAQLLREVARHQQEIDERLGQYTFKMKETVHVFNDKGKVYQEQTRESEVYPVPGHSPVFKLLSENGAPLTPERAAKEAKRAGEELEKAEREREKERARREREREKRAAKGAKAEDDEEAEDARLFLSAMTRACEFVAPRRERFREREAIVFDFRPRADYKPQNHLESLVASLTGVVWVDPIDKQFMRFEAQTLKSFKIAGGFVASIKPGAAFFYEQARTSEGMWMPRAAQFEGAMKFLFLIGVNVRLTQEFSDYRRFNTETKEVKIDAPKSSKQ
jgi:hypothetical protein